MTTADRKPAAPPVGRLVFFSPGPDAGLPQDTAIVTHVPLPQASAPRSANPAPPLPTASFFESESNALNAACVAAEAHGYVVALIPRDQLVVQMAAQAVHDVAQQLAKPPRVPAYPYELGRRAVERLKAAEGGALSRVEAAALLKISLPGLYGRVRRREVVAWTESNGKLRFPKWQFGDNGMLPGVQECLVELGKMDEWAVMRFFLTPNPSEEDRSALEFLREGQIERAVEMARRSAPHG